MDTSVDRARVGLAGPKTPQGLTAAKLRQLVPGERAYKVGDGGNGLYVVVSSSGSKSFRYDYRLSGRRGTLTHCRETGVPRDLPDGDEQTAAASQFIRMSGPATASIDRDGSLPTPSRPSGFAKAALVAGGRAGA